MDIVLFKMIDFKHKELKIYLLPCIRLEYLEKYISVRIAWLFFDMGIYLLLKPDK